MSFWGDYTAAPSGLRSFPANSFAVSPGTLPELFQGWNFRFRKCVSRPGCALQFLHRHHDRRVLWVLEA